MYRQRPQIYVDAIEFTNHTIPEIEAKLKEKNLQYRLYTKDMSCDKHKHIINTIFITHRSSEYRVTYGYYLIFYEKGTFLMMSKEDFYQRYEAVNAEGPYNAGGREGFTEDTTTITLPKGFGVNWP